MRKVMVIIASFVFAFAVSAASAKDCDFAINKGPVMNPETDYDQVAYDGIRDGRIVVITQDQISGKQKLDAIGLLQVYFDS